MYVYMYMQLYIAIASYIATLYILTVLIDVKYICTHVVITVNLCISICSADAYTHTQTIHTESLMHIRCISYLQTWQCLK